VGILSTLLNNNWRCAKGPQGRARKQKLARALGRRVMAGSGPCANFGARARAWGLLLHRRKDYCATLKTYPWNFILHVFLKLLNLRPFLFGMHFSKCVLPMRVDKKMFGSYRLHNGLNNFHMQKQTQMHSNKSPTCLDIMFYEHRGNTIKYLPTSLQSKYTHHPKKVDGLTK